MILLCILMYEHLCGRVTATLYKITFLDLFLYRYIMSVFCYQIVLFILLIISWLVPVCAFFVIF